MRRVLLSGGSGFVGANLARRLLGDGHEVHLLLRPGFRPWRIEEIRAHLRLHTAVLDDRESVARVVASVRPEWVFHLAAHGAYPTQTDIDAMIRTNLAGTASLLDACLATGCSAFVNAGSSSEYGFKDHAPAETEPLEPNSAYAVTKAAATMYCRLQARRHDAWVPTLRLYSVYGPYEEPTRLLPTLIARGLQGRLPPLVAPETARDYVFTEDVVDALLLAAVRRGGDLGAVFNVGSGVQTTLREIVELARRLLGITEEPRWGSLPPRQWDTSVWVADNHLIAETLGWRPAHTLEQGVKAMIDWMRVEGLPSGPARPSL